MNVTKGLIIGVKVIFAICIALLGTIIAGLILFGFMSVERIDPQLDAECANLCTIKGQNFYNSAGWNMCRCEYNGDMQCYNVKTGGRC